MDEVSTRQLPKSFELVARDPLNFWPPSPNKTEFSVVRLEYPVQAGYDDCGAFVLYNADAVLRRSENGFDGNGKDLRLRHAALLEKYTQV